MVTDFVPTVNQGTGSDDDLHIDPVFSKNQRRIWTGDGNGSEAAWKVYFFYGDVYWGYVNYFHYVRPVRSVR